MRLGGRLYPWESLRSAGLGYRRRGGPYIAFDADRDMVRASALTRLSMAIGSDVGVLLLRADPRLVVELANALIADPAGRRRLGTDGLLHDLRRGVVAAAGLQPPPSRLIS